MNACGKGKEKHRPCTMHQHTNLMLVLIVINIGHDIFFRFINLLRAGTQSAVVYSLRRLGASNKYLNQIKQKRQTPNRRETEKIKGDSKQGMAKNEHG